MSFKIASFLFFLNAACVVHSHELRSSPELLMISNTRCAKTGSSEWSPLQLAQRRAFLHKFDNL